MSELDKYLNRRAKEFEDVLHDMLDAYGAGDTRGFREAEDAFATRIQQILVLSSLLGRASAWRAYDRFVAGNFAEDPFTVPFEEALDDVITREPRVVPSNIVGREARQEWMAELYSREHAFAAVRSASEKLTKRVQDAIAKLVKSEKAAGKTTSEIMKMALEEAHDWPRWYAATVWETNVSNAYQNGRFEQVKDPVVAEVIPALEVVGVADERERPNHKPFRGLRMRNDDPRWQNWRPIYGWRCRHGLNFVPFTEWEAKGEFIPPNIHEGHYDKGFKPEAA